MAEFMAVHGDKIYGPYETFLEAKERLGHANRQPYDQRIDVPGMSAVYRYGAGFVGSRKALQAAKVLAPDPKPEPLVQPRFARLQYGYRRGAFHRVVCC
jgi:hypothetical protein